MIKNKILKILKSFLLSALLIVTIGVPTLAKTQMKPYVIKESSIIREQKQILIYHTHTEESYKDFTIVEAGEDLAKKLQDKGYIVTHVKENFSKDYNKAYDNSRAYLESLDLTQYSLIIDLHRDSLESNNANTVNVWGVDVAKSMFVYSKAAATENSKNIINTLENNLGNVARNTFSYNHGINCFNQDLSENSVLIEAGNNNNTKWEIKRLCTHLANSINDYLKEK